jgi:glutathione peroxidase
MKPLALMLLTLMVWAGQTSAAECPAILQHELPALRSSEQVDLCKRYAGKPLIVVNTASFCGYTPQFTGLEAIYQQYRQQGLEILGIPSNDFRQEARDSEAIAEVCYVNYGVTFQMAETQSVTGQGAHPLYRELAAQSGQAPRWNFHKYLIDRQGRVVASFPSDTRPDDPALIKAIESAL